MSRVLGIFLILLAFLLPVEAHSLLLDRSAGADVTVTVSDILGGNQPPVALAGPDASAITLRPLALAGFATDDGLPSGTLLTTWSRSAGRSGGVRFDDASQTTTATFSLPGVYTLRLSAQDGRLCDGCQRFRCATPLPSPNLLDASATNATTRFYRAVAP